MKNRPYRVLCKAGGEDWHRERASRLTATGVSTMLGTNPWMTREQYLTEKVSGESSFRPNKYTESGQFFEVPNMRYFSAVTGMRTWPTNVMLEWRVDPTLSCTLDGFVAAPRGPLPDKVLCKESWVWRVRELAKEHRGVGVIEMKQINIFSGRRSYLKSSVPPEHYLQQLQTQLVVTGLDWGVLCARIGVADMRAYFVPRDDTFADTLLSVCNDYRSETGHG